jgi:lipopolysaccharide/colanic/teichoic acid biosynthesis glycosyltransferase/glycosyltransferase involved in cell wall biosynthesis
MRRILVVTAVDAMAWLLLRPYLHGLARAGYEVHIACMPGVFLARLQSEGFHLHPVHMRRSFNPFVHLRPVLELVKLLQSIRFSAISLHSPIAAGVARLAAAFVRRPNLTYVVHGFYFHEGTPWFWRKMLVAIEWILGGLTDAFVFVSEEDRQTALRAGIVRNGAAAVTIHNGVDLAAFSPRPPAAVVSRKGELRIPADAPVVGIVARIVKEKGYREFFEMARALRDGGSEARFLVVGDSLVSDRDQFGAVFQQLVRDSGLSDRFVFTGLTDGVARYLSLMDVFVLPTYREGFPRSIIEAMGAGLPVIATDIRGCREAVADGTTGLIVPPRNLPALTGAVQMLLGDRDLARKMGAAGRRRAEELYDLRHATDRFVKFTRAQDLSHAACVPWLGYRAAKAVLDRVISLLLLIVLSPVFAVVAALVRVLMGAPVFFRQMRPGLDARPFELIKFRTMTTAAAATDAERLTPFGRILRAASLDELPQLWNVLRGEMSLVGPRPLLPEYLPLYSERQRLRHEVRPGMTGWAQVCGRNALSWKDKLELDAWYVENRGLALDIRILWRTVFRVLAGEGVSRDGHATTPYFTGCGDE